MIITVLSFLAVFTVIVLVHEFGHFYAARKAGVKVYEFSIGFPFSPRLVTLFRSRETRFTLRLLPLGGFVSFSQENEEESIDLFDTTPFRRALILMAGSLSNFAFAFIVLIPVFMLAQHLSPVAAMAKSAGVLWAIVTGTIAFIANIFLGHGGMEGLSGPVGIAVMAGKAASAGFINLLYFTGVISISLGIMNLFPLPALDGGQLLMLFIETLRRKRFGLKTYQMVNLIGLALFLAITILVTYKDLAGLVA